MCRGVFKSVLLVAAAAVFCTGCGTTADGERWSLVLGLGVVRTAAPSVGDGAAIDRVVASGVVAGPAVRGLVVGHTQQMTVRVQEGVLLDLRVLPGGEIEGETTRWDETGRDETETSDNTETTTTESERWNKL